MFHVRREGGTEGQGPLASSEAFSFCLANSASLQHCSRILAAFSLHVQRLQCMCMHVSTGEDWPQHVRFSSSMNNNARALSDVNSYHLKNSILSLQTEMIPSSFCPRVICVWMHIF